MIATSVIVATTTTLLIKCYLLMLIHFSYGFNIELLEKTNLEFDGQIITNESLHNYLENHEKILLFGNDNLSNKTYQLVNIRRHQRRRAKRSNSKFLNVRLNVTKDEPITIKLEKSNKLIDDSFVYIRRYENSSTIVHNFKELTKKLDNCFYRGSNSALDVCEGNIKGLLQFNSKTFTIHPLPQRFGTDLHIIVESTLPSTTEQGNELLLNANVNDTIVIEPENDAFEPTLFDNDGLMTTMMISRKVPEMLNRSIENDTNNVDDTDALDQNANGNGTDNEVIDRRQKIIEMDRRQHIKTRQNHRAKRFIGGNVTAIPQILHVETAIFIDRDLYLHMAKNYPKDTESELIRFVLAMINGVQILYHHPSLGHPIDFVLKRLEILHTDPKGLRRSSDIDIFLNSFCFWQKKFNPTSNEDILHFDHAIILTGLDLYAMSKNGKVSSQVVGLAPVGGMCTSTSSCTINEGKHFESVFVVAHEIGHNLGMRHDTSENKCDPNLYVMSPTLGSGKITWSKCSRNYLKTFLKTSQAKCLFDRSKRNPILDHDVEGTLPGERFNADKQCMLKYGIDSVRSREQPLHEICRDLHCEKDKHTWTSHPSLEGTKCGDFMWCKSGECIMKTDFVQSIPVIRFMETENRFTNSLDRRNLYSYMQESTLDHSKWSNWSQPSDCESGCLYGESGRLRDGSTGLRTYTRNCLETRSFNKCIGTDKKYEACSSKQCFNLSRTTVLEFANQICERAQRFDSDIIGKGLQKFNGDSEDSCKVYCNTKSGIPKAKHWTFPDGTTCHTKDYRLEYNYYCVNGRCEKFTCNDSANNVFNAHPKFCPINQQLIDHLPDPLKPQPPPPRNLFQKDRFQLQSTDQWNRSFPTNKIFTGNVYRKSNQPNIRRSDLPDDNWKVKGLEESTFSRKSDKWVAETECYSNCMEMSQGIRTVYSAGDYTANIQLCEPDFKECDEVETTTSFSIKLCLKYQQKVRGLSGNGMQIFANDKDPDRGCKVACQDEYLPHRFYLVNGEQGHFPIGTKCSRTEHRYCLNGKCLKFNSDLVLLRENYQNLSFRTKNNLASSRTGRRFRRSNSHQNEDVNRNRAFLKSTFENVNIRRQNTNDSKIQENQIDLKKPIYVSMGDYNLIFSENY